MNPSKLRSYRVVWFPTLAEIQEADNCGEGFA